MPPNRTSTAGKPFKPPRSAGSTANKPTASKSQSTNSTSRSKATQPSSTAQSRSDVEIEIEEPEAEPQADPFADAPAATIPPELLTRLLHEFMDSSEGPMRISKGADRAVGKYMETFVREAIARAAFERAEAAREGGVGAADGFLEVEDLEKLAPQLLLDF